MIFPWRPVNSKSARLFAGLPSAFTKQQTLGFYAAILCLKNAIFTAKQRNCFVLPFSEGGHLDYTPARLRPFHSATKIVKTCDS